MHARALFIYYLWCETLSLSMMRLFAKKCNLKDASAIVSAIITHTHTLSLSQKYYKKGNNVSVTLSMMRFVR